MARSTYRRLGDMGMARSMQVAIKSGTIRIGYNGSLILTSLIYLSAFVQAAEKEAPPAPPAEKPAEDGPEGEEDKANPQNDDGEKDCQERKVHFKIEEGKEKLLDITPENSDIYKAVGMKDLIPIQHITIFVTRHAFYIDHDGKLKLKVKLVPTVIRTIFQQVITNIANNLGTLSDDVITYISGVAAKAFLNGSDEDNVDEDGEGSGNEEGDEAPAEGEAAEGDAPEEEGPPDAVDAPAPAPAA